MRKPVKVYFEIKKYVEIDSADYGDLNEMVDAAREELLSESITMGNWKFSHLTSEKFSYAKVKGLGNDEITWSVIPLTKEEN